MKSRRSWLWILFLGLWVNLATFHQAGAYELAAWKPAYRGDLVQVQVAGGVSLGGASQRFLGGLEERAEALGIRLDLTLSRNLRTAQKYPETLRADEVTQDLYSRLGDLGVQDNSISVAVFLEENWVSLRYGGTVYELYGELSVGGLEMPEGRIPGASQLTVDHVLSFLGDLFCSLEKKRGIASEALCFQPPVLVKGVAPEYLPPEAPAEAPNPPPARNPAPKPPSGGIDWRSLASSGKPPSKPSSAPGPDPDSKDPFTVPSVGPVPNQGTPGRRLDSNWNRRAMSPKDFRDLAIYFQKFFASWGLPSGIQSFSKRVGHSEYHKLWQKYLALPGVEANANGFLWIGWSSRARSIAIRFEPGSSGKKFYASKSVICVRGQGIEHLQEVLESYACQWQAMVERPQAPRQFRDQWPCSFPQSTTYVIGPPVRPGSSPLSSSRSGSVVGGFFSFVSSTVMWLVVLGVGVRTIRSWIPDQEVSTPITRTASVTDRSFDPAETPLSPDSFQIVPPDPAPEPEAGVAEGIGQAAVRADLADFQCQYCGDSSLFEDLASCESCETLHHISCFRENGSCTTFGCGTRRYRKVKAKTQD